MYFPQVLGWFTDVQSPLVADFLNRWPTLPEAQRARPDTVRRFLHQHNCRKAERIEQQLEELQQAVAVTTDPAVVEPTVIMVRALVEGIASLSKGIKEFEDKIEEVMRLRTQAWQCTLRPSFSSPCPPQARPSGTDASVAPRLVAFFGTNRERYHSADEVACFTGMAPVRERGGK